MKALIVLAVVIAGAFLLIEKPWQPKRYDNTRQGTQAKKIDAIVDQAIRNTNTWEARAMLKGEMVIGGVKVYEEFVPTVESLYKAGAKDVSFAYIHRSVRTGDQAEGLYAVLPEDSRKRAALIALAAKWPHPPKECNQKYIYLKIMGWDVDAPEPSFLGN